MSDLIGKKFPVLDDGFVRLIDVMGDDSSIVDSARLSYGKGTRKLSEDRDLLRYLMRHWHTTPFEMAEVKIHVRVPMDTWRQWIRHRTASVNEYSTRYSEAIDSCQKTDPDAWRLQSVANKQGSAGYLPEVDDSLDVEGHDLSVLEKDFHNHAWSLYQTRLRAGVAREQARKDLPLSTYTEAFWKCDLKNTLGFLRLRMDSHAQFEIRQYANVIGREIVAKLFPQTWSAFEDYQLNALTLSTQEQRAIRAFSAGEPNADFLEFLFPNKRERQECEAKLVSLGLITKDS